AVRLAALLHYRHGGAPADRGRQGRHGTRAAGGAGRRGGWALTNGCRRRAANHRLATDGRASRRPAGDDRRRKIMVKKSRGRAKTTDAAENGSAKNNPVPARTEAPFADDMSFAP